jgi:hypothetical protein
MHTLTVGEERISERISESIEREDRPQNIRVNDDDGDKAEPKL